MVTDLVIDGVERAALDLDENIVGCLEVGNWNVDKLEDVGVTGSLKGDGVHRCWNRRHVGWSGVVRWSSKRERQGNGGQGVPLSSRMLLYAA